MERLGLKTGPNANVVPRSKHFAISSTTAHFTPTGDNGPVHLADDRGMDNLIHIFKKIGTLMDGQPAMQ